MPVPKNKSTLIARFNVSPIIHSRLLPPVTGTCHCGRPLTDEFYEFHYVEKADASNSGTFLAGPDCGDKIMGRLQHAPIPFVDPVTGLPTTPPTRTPPTSTTPAPTAAPRDTLNKEVLQAIYLIRVLTGRSPTGGLLKTLQFVQANPTRAPADWRVASLNAYVRSMLTATASTLSAAIAARPSGKKFNFPLAAAALSREQARNAALPPSDPHIKPVGHYTDWLN